MSLVALPGDDAADGSAHIDTLVADLHDYERQLRRTFAAGGRLAVSLAAASETQGLSPTAGHQIVAAFGHANMNVATALSHSADGHRLLERLGARLNVTADGDGYGDGQKDPDSYSVRSASPVAAVA